MQSTPNLVNDARANALQNAADDAHLPPLPENYVFGCLEIYLGEQEEPALSLVHGQIIELDVPLNPTPVLQIVGDDGFVFIAVDGETKLNRLQHCKLPLFGVNFLHQEVNDIIGP